MKKSTLSTIAKKLGISVSTVSRALSNKDGVSDSLRKRIIHEAIENGYIDKLPLILEERSRILGIIVPNIQNPFFLNFLKGAESVLFHRNFRFIVCNIDEDLYKERIYLKWLQESKVMGIIAAPAFSESGKTNLDIYRELDKSIPVVLYDREFYQYKGFDSVTFDNEGTIIDGVKHLYDKGHRKIGILLSKRGNFCTRERFKGYKKAVKQFDLPFVKSWVLDNLYSNDDIVTKKIESFLSQGDLPTAVIGTTNNITYNFLKAAKKLQITVPDDISLLGFGEIPQNELLNPPLSIMKQPSLEIGRIAATTMLARLDRQQSEPSRIVLKSTVVSRNSVKTIL